VPRAVPGADRRFTEVSALPLLRGRPRLPYEPNTRIQGRAKGLKVVELGENAPMRQKFRALIPKRDLPLKAMTAVVLILTCLSSPSASAVKRSSQEPRWMMVCFHPGKSRYTAEVHPGHCALWGDRGAQFLGAAVDRLDWSNWGGNPAKASGISVRDKSQVKVTAFRPVYCVDGRIFYSRVRVRFPEADQGQTLRLLTCGGPSLIS